MNRTIAACALIGWIVVIICVTAARPAWLSDSNGYLKEFLQHDFLGFMGVIITITLASASNLFIELNKL